MTAIAIADRVRETTSTSGTGAVTLSGATPDFRSFNSAFTSGQTVCYCIDDLVGNWEVGFGIFTAPATLSRSVVFSSSNGNALVNFSAAAKQVFCTAAAEMLAVLDTNGNLVGPIVPRTNTLASLLALVSEPTGELASATDQPAVVQFGSWGAATYQPWSSLQSATSTNVAASTLTLNPLTQIARVNVPAAATSLAITITNGYVDGQPLQVEIVPGGGAITSLTCGAASLSSTALNLPSSTAGTALEMRWRASDSTWQLVRSYLIAPQPAFAVLLGPNASVSQASGIALQGISQGAQANAQGRSAFASASGTVSIGGNNNAAFGVSSISLGTAGSFVGGSPAPSLAYGVASRAESQGPFALAFSAAFAASVAGGAYSRAIGGGQTGGPNWTAATKVAYTALSGSGTGPYTATVSSGAATNAFMETGCPITVGPLTNSGAGGQNYQGTVSSTASTSITFNLTETPPVALASTGFIQNCAPGQCARAEGIGAVAVNFGDETRSNAWNNNPGDAQVSRVTLSGLTSSAAALILTATGVPLGAAVTQYGNATISAGPRLFVQPSQAAWCRLRVLGKQTGSGNVAYGEWLFLAIRNGSGAPSISGVQAVGTPGSTISGITMPSTPGTGNPTSGASLTISGNSTYNSVEIAVFGASSAVGWSASLERLEAIEV